MVNAHDRSDDDLGSQPEGESECERYAKIFDHSHDGIMIVDFETDAIVDVNPAACDLLGYTREELLSIDPAAIHPDDIERVRDEFLSQVRENGSGWTDELQCLTKGGETVSTEISGAVLDGAAETAERESASDAPTRMVAILHDVSDSVAYRRELEQTVERLERFSQVLSHDLRNPLAVVSGHAEAAQNVEDDAEHIEAIERATDRIEELVDDLLTLTRRERLIGTTEPVDIEHCAHRAWECIETSEATLVVESTETVEADPSRFRELLENLFRNSIEHGSEGVTITAGRVSGGDRERGFYVADDGPGVPPGERDSVFEWGKSLSDAGTGMGLAIVAEIADAHNWEYAVSESDSGGARFEFTVTEA